MGLIIASKIRKAYAITWVSCLLDLDSIFAPRDGLDLSGDMDATDREIEQFKQFCFNSVPLQNRTKVNFDVRNIAFKKKN